MKKSTTHKKPVRKASRKKTREEYLSEFKVFDATEYLTSEAIIREYLAACAEDPNPEVLILALNNVARARGMAQIAKAAGLGRESLYKALSAGSQPRHATLNAVLHALGMKFTVMPISQ